MSNEISRQTTPANQDEYRDNVLVALVHEGAQFIKNMFDKYGPKRIHLLVPMYGKTSPISEYYSDQVQLIYGALLGNDAYFYQNLGDDEKKDVFGYEIVVHPVPDPHYYSSMVSVINDILYNEAKNFVNVYASLIGSPTYAAAAATVVPQYSNAMLVSHYAPTVHFPEEYVEKGARGAPSTIGNLFEVRYLFSGSVDMVLLKAFKLYCSIKEEYRTNSNVIRTLIYNGLWGVWKRDVDLDFKPMLDEKNYSGTSVELENICLVTDTGEKNSNEGQWKKDPKFKGTDDTAYRAMQKKEFVEFSRYYLQPWFDYGWLEDETTGKRRKRSSLYICENGLKQIEMFCSDKVYLVGASMICPERGYMRWVQRISD